MATRLPNNTFLPSFSFYSTHIRTYCEYIEFIIPLDLFCLAVLNTGDGGNMHACPQL